MARDTRAIGRDENPHQGASHSFGKPSDTTDRADRDTAATDSGVDRGDRERSIQTNRERGSGMARRAGASSPAPSYGLNATPFTLMRRMADEMDRIFADFGFSRSGLGMASAIDTDLARDRWRDTSALEQAAWSPQVETFRRGDKLVVRADLPGLDKDDVRVEVDDGVLTISGERSEENEENRDDYYRSERSYGQFYRAIPLPDGVSGDDCEATFKDGVLEVTLPAPKNEERKAKRVQVR